MLDTLKVKKGADITKLKGPMDRPLMVYALYCKAAGVQGVITEGIRPEGKTFSLHSSGNTVDLRGRDFTENQQTELTDIFRLVLGSDYDVIFYPTKTKHFHVEFNSAKEYNRVFSLNLEIVE